MKCVLALILGFALVAGAAAKDGVVAHLENPGALRGAPGTKVTLVWKLRDADRHPFGASGIYVRLHGLSTTSATATQIAPGRFRARVVIPRGGARSVAIALIGWSSGPQGTKRGDWRFPIDNDPTR
jgi:hypothetical protein